MSYGSHSFFSFIALRYSADPLRAISSLRLVQTIFKVCPQLDYLAHHGPQTCFLLYRGCVIIIRTGIFRHTSNTIAPRVKS